MKNGKDIYALIIQAQGELGYKAYVDLSVCDEIYIHWRRDISKLSVVHKHEERGLAIEKVVGYLSFWIRKLQPTSKARPVTIGEDGEIITHNKTNNQFNEIIAIYIIKLFLVKHLTKKADEAGKQSSALREKYLSQADGVKLTFNALFSAPEDGSSPYSPFLDVCLYDMRFRTFGPHHITHAVRYILNNSKIDLSSLNKTFSTPQSSAKKIYHMLVLVSAPGDVQAAKILPQKNHSTPIIPRIFNDNYRKWISDFGVAVSYVAQPDFDGGKENPQLGINEQIEQLRPDAYFGIIDSRFGTETAGFASGTMAEFETASKIIPGSMFSFGFRSKPEIDTSSEDSLNQATKIAQFKKTYPGLYWSYVENEDGSNFEKEFTRRVEMKIKKFLELIHS